MVGNPSFSIRDTPQKFNSSKKRRWQSPQKNPASPKKDESIKKNQSPWNLRRFCSGVLFIRVFVFQSERNTTGKSWTHKSFEKGYVTLKQTNMTMENHHFLMRDTSTHSWLFCHGHVSFRGGVTSQFRENLPGDFSSGCLLWWRPPTEDGEGELFVAAWSRSRGFHEGMDTLKKLSKDICSFFWN